MKYICNTCLGVYSDTSGDGMRYFHACAPELIAEEEYKERKEKRDENVGQKKEGKGRNPLS